jgi:hypothetical protein
MDISDTKEPSQKKPTPGRPPTYTIDDRILLALMLGKYSISARAGVQVHRFVEKLEKAASPHTALRSLVEAHVCFESYSVILLSRRSMGRCSFLQYKDCGE